MTKYYTYILILTFPFLGYGQLTLENRAVMMSAGATDTQEGIVHSYNIGQSIVSTETSASVEITQGFLQPFFVFCEKHVIQKTGNGICGTNPVSLSLTTSQNYSIVRWTLLENGDTLNVYNGTSPTYTPTYPGKYMVTYFGLFCVNITDPVEVELAGTAGVPQISESGSGMLSTIENASYTYQWYIELGGQKYAIYGQTNASYSPIFNGEYFVEVSYDQNGCRVMSEQKSFGFLARNISEENVKFSNNTVYLSVGEEVSVNLYPYPSYDKFTLDLYSDYTGSFQVKLIDMEGTEVQSQTLYKNGVLFSEDIDVSELSEGLYGVMIYTETGVHSSKMLIVE